MGRPELGNGGHPGQGAPSEGPSFRFLAAVVLVVVAVVVALLLGAWALLRQPRATKIIGGAGAGAGTGTGAEAFLPLDLVSPYGRATKRGGGAKKRPAAEKDAAPGKWHEQPTWDDVFDDPALFDAYDAHHREISQRQEFDWGPFLAELDRAAPDRDTVEYGGTIRVGDDGVPHLLECERGEAHHVPTEVSERVWRRPGTFCFHTHPTADTPLPSTTDFTVAEMVNGYLFRYVSSLVVHADSIIRYGPDRGVIDLYLESTKWRDTDPEFTMALCVARISAHAALPLTFRGLTPPTFADLQRALGRLNDAFHVALVRNPGASDRFLHPHFRYYYGRIPVSNDALDAFLNESRLIDHLVAKGAKTGVFEIDENPDRLPRRTTAAVAEANLAKGV